MASYLELTVADLTVNGQDLGLAALNQVRMQAELNHDFNFQRKLLTLVVDQVTGGSLGSAVLYGTATTADIKLILDMGLFDSDNNLFPTEWTTSSEGMERLREEFAYAGSNRYPTDGQVLGHLAGQSIRRFTITNDQVYSFPKGTAGQTISLGIEAYIFSSDWTSNSNTQALSGSTGATGANTTYYRNGTFNSHPLYTNINPIGGSASNAYAIWYDTAQWRITAIAKIGAVGADYFTLTGTSQNPAGTYTGSGAFGGTAVLASSEADTTSDIWLTKGAQFLQWAAIVQLNERYKFYVPRTEGNLPPPSALAQEGLNSLINWDVYKYEQRRRHGR